MVEYAYPSVIRRDRISNSGISSGRIYIGSTNDFPGERGYAKRGIGQNSFG